MNPDRQAADDLAQQVKEGVQKAAVRVIASELDRRSGALEKALADSNERIAALGQAQQTLSEQITAVNDYVRRVHEHLGEVEKAHSRLMGLHSSLASRVDLSDADRSEIRRDLAAVAGEFSTMRDAFTRLDRLIEGRPA